VPFYDNVDIFHLNSEPIYDVYDDDEDGDPLQQAMVLNADKKYYPTTEEVYGPGKEALVMDEDKQPLEQPIVADALALFEEMRGKGYHADVMRYDAVKLFDEMAGPG
jgi:hypothetical protein